MTFLALTKTIKKRKRFSKREKKPFGSNGSPPFSSFL